MWRHDTAGRGKIEGRLGERGESGGAGGGGLEVEEKVEEKTSRVEKAQFTRWVIASQGARVKEEGVGNRLLQRVKGALHLKIDKCQQQKFLNYSLWRIEPKQETVGTNFSRLKVLRTCLTSISIGCNSHATQIDKVWALFSTDSRIWRRFVKIEDDPGMARKNASSSQEWQRQKPGAGVLWET